MNDVNNQKNILNQLNERVKELTCLYALSKITADLSKPFEERMNQFLKIIPTGWQHPEKLKVYLEIDGLKFGNKIALSKGQFSTIEVENKTRGTVRVSYPENLEQNIGYLVEEQQLLNQIANEIGVLKFRYEQKEKERILNEKLRTEDRLHVLAEVTAGVAHELNTPLGNILGFSELLKKSLVNKQHLEDLDRIITSTLNAREIVKKLMFFSCEMPSNFKLINVNDVIKSSIQLLKLQLKEKNITLIEKLDNKIPTTKGDEVQLTQVFLNLILNAIAASDKGSELEVSTNHSEKHIHIEFKDFGKGIPTNLKEKIFQPFYTTKTTGTGLGLAVVHGIIQGHNGQIDFDSTEDQGTTFKVMIPY